MSHDQENLKKQSKINQKAVSGVSAGGNVTMGDIIQQAFHVFLPWSQSGNSRVQREHRFRGILLNRVEEFWLKNQLFANEIELRLREITGFKEKEIKSFSEIINITNVFDQWKPGQALLILGEAGVGKTTILLQLVQKFLKRAREDVLNQQLPVIFDLSSWSEHRLSLDQWLVRELKTKYRVAESLSKNWIKEGQMVLFLDGLNEVSKKDRLACVQAINRFMEDYGDTEIIICSRLQEYINLDEYLKIRYSICVQPLTSKQINQQIDRYGSELNNLKALFQEDTVLLELAQTPLMLNILIQSHENVAHQGLLEDRRRSLFDTYISQIFIDNRNRVGKKGQIYEEENTKSWLIFLAQQMSRSSSTIFLIEQIQPYWLTKEQRKKYRLLVNWYYGMIAGFFFGTAYGIIVYYYLEYFFPSMSGTLLQAISMGMIQGIIIGPVEAHLQKNAKLTIKTDIQVKFSFLKVKENISKSLILGLSVGIGVFAICLGTMPTIFSYDWNHSLFTGLIGGIFFTIVLMISRLSSNCFIETPMELTVKPNQGILNLLHQATMVGVISFLVIEVIYLSVISMVGEMNMYMFSLGLFNALITALVVPHAQNSGKFFLLHYALRFVIKRDGMIPANYSDFLEYAQDLTLIKKIGGGYKFHHPLLQEYMASLSLRQNDTAIL